MIAGSFYFVRSPSRRWRREVAGPQFRSLRETWATTPVGRLTITIIGGIAEFECELIRARCGEGIRRAKRQVSTWGPPKLTKHTRGSAAGSGEETLTEIARAYNVSLMTISRVKTRLQHPGRGA